MRFTIIYRNGAGAKTVETIEASSRADVFARLKTRGIIPLNVEEGNTTPKGLHPVSGPVKTWGILAAAVLIALVAVFWLLRTPATQPKKQVKKQPVTQTPPASALQPQKHKPVAVTPIPVAKPAPTPASDVPTHPRHPDAKRISCVTNTNGMIVERFQAPDGKTYKIMKPVSDSSAPTASDQVLSIIATTPPGEVAPPLPIPSDFDARFKQSLETPIEILPTDSDAVKERKATILALREELQQAIAGGSSAQEILGEHQRIAAENAKIRNEAREEYRSFLEKGDEEGAKGYLDSMNTALEQMGIPPIAPLETVK